MNSYCLPITLIVRGHADGGCNFASAVTGVDEASALSIGVAGIFGEAPVLLQIATPAAILTLHRPPTSSETERRLEPMATTMSENAFDLVMEGESSADEVRRELGAACMGWP